MQRSSSFDMTTGGISKKMLNVALPIMGTQILQLAYNFLDMFWMGRIQDSGVPGGAIAAAGIGGMYMWLSVSLLLIGRMGAGVGVAQNIGRGDMDTAKKFMQNSLMLAIALGVAFCTFLIVGRHPLVGFFGMDDASLTADATTYLVIIALGVTPTFVEAALNGTFSAAGNSRTPLIASIVGTVVNAVLDPIMIFGFKWGIVGAAVSTIIAQYLSMIILIIAMKRAKHRPFERVRLFARVDVNVIKQIFRWSTPVGLENAAFCFLSMILSRFVGSYGTVAFTVARIGSQVEAFSWLVGGGFGSAVLSFVGQNFGAGKWTRIRAGFRSATLMMTVWGLACGVGLFFGGKLLFRLFTGEVEVLVLGAVYMQILAFCQLPSCLEAVAGNTFKGIGKTMQPAMVSFVCNGGRVLLAWWLMNTSLGLNGIWIAMTVGACSRGIISMLWFTLQARFVLPKDDILSAA